MTTRTDVRRGTGYLTTSWAIFTALGLLLGAGLHWLLGWFVRAPFPLPFGGLWRRLAGWDDPWRLLALLAIGAAVGGYFALHHHADQLTVLVGPQRLTVRRGQNEVGAARSDVSAVYREAGHLVLLGQAGEVLVDVKGDLDEEQLVAALRAHGYPWRVGGDPHAAAYRRFVPDDPDLSAKANALLKARATVLRDNRPDVADELRLTLAEADIVVRDRGRDQHWRPITRPDPG